LASDQRVMCRTVSGPGPGPGPGTRSLNKGLKVDTQLVT